MLGLFQSRNPGRKGRERVEKLITNLQQESFCGHTDQKQFTLVPHTWFVEGHTVFYQKRPVFFGASRICCFNCLDFAEISEIRVNTFSKKICFNETVAFSPVPPKLKSPNENEII